MRLENKKCLITGAANGIGAAIAKAFAQEGATLFITDTDVAAAKELAQMLNATALALDVSSENDWENVANHAPMIDVVVNNAGITGVRPDIPHDPENAALADWRAVHAVNLDGVFLGCRYAIRAMRASQEQDHQGSIINISSVSGMLGAPFAAAYASSKAAVRHHTKTVALYCAQQGLNIRCNSIHPGAVMTPMWDEVLGDGAARGEAIKAAVADVPLARFGEASEVAALAVMLASDEATYMSGAELVIDGGMMAGRLPPRG